MSNYWEKRAVRRMYDSMELAENVADELAKIYLKSSRYISHKADEIFEKFKTKHHLSEAEARELISKLQDKDSLDELKRLISESKIKKKELLPELESAAYQARLERLRQLQNELDLVMQNVYLQEKDFTTSFYTDLANETFYNSMFDIQKRAGVGFTFNHISEKQINKVLSMDWSGANYSKRIWKNTKGLADTLKEELLISLLAGRTNRETADIIANKFASGAAKARRLVRTESNFISSELNFEAYKEAGIEEYQFIATLDLRTSDICRELDGKIFKVVDRQVGVNCNPMHPWCRSTTVAVIDRDYIQKMSRSARDPVTGDVKKVPASMNYIEWYDKFVKNSPEIKMAEEQQNKVANNDESDIIFIKDTKEVINLHSVGKIDREIYKCITEDIVTDEVIITDERIGHIKERHPNDYERYYEYLKEIVENPDFIVETNKPKTALILKEIVESDEKRFKTVLRLTTPTDNPEFKNSIITFMRINEKEWSRLLRNKKILYKKE